MFLIKKLTAGMFDQSIYSLIISNVTGSFILTYYFWDRFFVDYPEYEKKPVWKPIAIFLGICIALLLFQILASKK